MTTGLPLLAGLVPMVTASQWAFWLLAPIMVLAALVMVFAKKPVHSALSLAVVMICLAVQYASQEAPFLFVVQIIVYTGAILMLFLFVVMLVGVDSTDSLKETLKGHKVAAMIAALALVVLLILAVGNAVTTDVIGTDHPVGLGQANAAGGNNVKSLAELVFTKYVLVFEATSALLITAAVGTMVLAHGEADKKKSQRERVTDRMAAYAEHGSHPGVRPNSGVYARTNQIGAPALLPDGTVAQDSISGTLATRGAIIDAGELKAPTHRAFASISAARHEVQGELE
ncbi:NADH-quinone oxidoreductase subunit J [Cutibacterium acnes]|uniref:NADH-quinone oxidoreductase subunit J n=1 Tax=Cutibacterium acnes TaxID=1747 RepID=A0AA44U3E4_CUTAC|nr:NADH-quinone oxidoreductase subunit J [Cutibacterium acnes]OFL43508.1 NADH:ubiquinone oxidoreductase subunit J [Propionibacterium sp. HMSC068C01]OFQ66297.1 NADH:ubiquinone oxidoreductase subunit J [Propionibacterium sp. HMSC075A12]EFT09148.1 NADH-ubiquinone/plastoquinone oxidoreductase chain 6 [Cutibacterium acnes HL082PA2]MCD1082730.1 NADH-quinone oxidoreductase subunit J [Cutibacterium acnes]MDK7570852.1 NADH-quinone oxidoreductase subunit J [Cutibacterium acnes]